MKKLIFLLCPPPRFWDKDVTASSYTTNQRIVHGILPLVLSNKFSWSISLKPIIQGNIMVNI
jgi:hypothetical protein